MTASWSDRFPDPVDPAGGGAAPDADALARAVEAAVDQGAYAEANRLLEHAAATPADQVVALVLALARRQSVPAVEQLLRGALRYARPPAEVTGLFETILDLGDAGLGDAPSLLLAGIDAGPERAATALSLLRSRGRSDDAENLLEDVGEQSAQIAAHVCLELAYSPVRYLNAVKRGLARLPVHQLAAALDVLEPEGAGNQLDGLLAQRAPIEFVSAVGILVQAGSDDRARLLLRAVVRAGVDRTVEVAAQFARARMHAETGALLGAVLPSAAPAGIARVLARFGGENAETARAIVAACLRHPDLPALRDAVAAAGCLDLFRAQLRELTETVDAGLLADMYVRLADRGCEEECRIVAAQARGRADLEAVLALLHQSGQHKAAYRLHEGL